MMTSKARHSSGLVGSAVIVCVPTPVDQANVPDLSPVTGAAEIVADAEHCLIIYQGAVAKDNDGTEIGTQCDGIGHEKPGAAAPGDNGIGVIL